jgi:SAM-dependent methyltransferase
VGKASTRVFYDGLAELYHLVYADWEASVERQGRALADVIRERWPGARRVLDAACGIGTQVLGLAAAGFEVAGSDLSEAALARARREAAARGLTIELRAADLRDLAAAYAPGFDVVLACDNAVAHLLSDDEIVAALRQMRALVRPGGGVVVSVRDYGAIDRTAARMMSYGARDTAAGPVFVFQSWDFVDEERYDLGLYFVHDEAGGPRVEVFRSRCYAVPLDRLAALFAAAGLVEVEVLRDRFFQPLVVASAPSFATVSR